MNRPHCEHGQEAGLCSRCRTPAPGEPQPRRGMWIAAAAVVLLALILLLLLKR